jgi:NADH dehydrogenase
MASHGIHVVTGAFGFSGKYIARRLLDAGHEVRTLTNSPHRANPFGGRIRAYPFSFDDPDGIAASLEGASVLYNNYWVRFNYTNEISFGYAASIENSRILFDAARRAGVRRIIHVSITNPSTDSPFEYFRGKAILERMLLDSGLSYAILRPAVLFGREDILINNIAWFLRRFPVFGVFGDGSYRLQPIYVDDLAQLAVSQGQMNENHIINAIGPETFSYRELVGEIGRIIGKTRPVVSIPPWLGYTVASVVGRFIHDVTITRDEIDGLIAGLLCTDSPPAGQTRLTDWARQHAGMLGSHYANELARRKNRIQSYDQL